MTRTWRRRHPVRSAGPRTRVAALSAAALAAGLLLGSSVCAGSAVASPATTAPSTATYPDLAPTPPMGWNNWTAFACDIDEDVILDNARALVSSGLAAKGYDTVTTDDCWMADHRDSAGNLVSNPTTFPHGMAWLGRRIHALGLKFGIYEDAGTQTCAGFPGVLGHERQDAALFASWKVDYVKLDGCNVPVPDGTTKEQAYHDAYQAWSDAMLATGRPMVFSVSAPAYFQDDGDAVWHDVIRWSAQVGNLWREGADIALATEDAHATWSSMLFNYDYNKGLADLQTKGRWNDPDFLLAGNHLTTTEARTQVSLWSVMAAPLISSTDLRHATADTVATLGNRAVIAVDQDRLGVQGRVVQTGEGYDVLAKPLADGSRAVALFNRSDTARTVTTTSATAGLGPRPVELTDLWTGDTTRSAGTISATVPPHGTVLYRVAAGADRGSAPATTLSWTPVATHGDTTVYQVGLDDHGIVPVTGARLRVTVPAGVTASPTSASFGRVEPGRTAVTRVALTQRVTQPGTTVAEVTGTATYRFGGGRTGSVTGDTTLVRTLPYPTLAAAFDNVGTTPESDPGPGNLDGGGDSYSRDALASVGVTPGSTVTAAGASFTWPSSAVGQPDNVRAEDQVVLQGGSGSRLAVLGAETGTGSGTVTVTYTDGTTSTGELGFPNWCCSVDTQYGATVAVRTDHRNTQAGPANFGIDYKVYVVSLPLDPTRTVRSVTLPDAPQIHVFGLTVVP